LRYKLVDFLDVDAIEMTVDDVNLISSQHNAAAISNPYVKNAIETKTNSILVLEKIL